MSSYKFHITLFLLIAATFSFAQKNRKYIPYPKNSDYKSDYTVWYMYQFNEEFIRLKDFYKKREYNFLRDEFKRITKINYKVDESRDKSWNFSDSLKRTALLSYQNLESIDLNMFFGKTIFRAYEYVPFRINYKVALDEFLLITKQYHKDLELIGDALNQYKKLKTIRVFYPNYYFLSKIAELDSLENLTLYHPYGAFPFYAFNKLKGLKYLYVNTNTNWSIIDDYSQYDLASILGTPTKNPLSSGRILEIKSLEEFRYTSNYFPLFQFKEGTPISKLNLNIRPKEGINYRKGTGDYPEINLTQFKNLEELEISAKNSILNLKGLNKINWLEISTAEGFSFKQKDLFFLTELKELVIYSYLSKKHLPIPMPLPLFTLPKVELLKIYGGNLNIPEEIGQLHSLKQLMIKDSKSVFTHNKNDFTSYQLPKSISKLTQLEDIYLIGRFNNTDPSDFFSYDSLNTYEAKELFYIAKIKHPINIHLLGVDVFAQLKYLNKSKWISTLTIPISLLKNNPAAMDLLPKVDTLQLSDDIKIWKKEVSDDKWLKPRYEKMVISPDDMKMIINRIKDKANVILLVEWAYWKNEQGRDYDYTIMKTLKTLKDANK